MSGRFGLLGEKLSHSFSPLIHGMLGDYEYTLIERQPDELEALFAEGGYDGFNVTIPYKKSVIPYMAELSDAAKRCGSVNTVIRRPDGTYFGDNTDFYGFSVMLEKSGIDVSEKKVLVLGNGGVAPTVREVLKDAGDAGIITISRSGEDNYDNLYRHRDAAVIVNTTPVGMYPGNGKSPVRISDFPDLEGALDLIFNPLCTELMLQAEDAGIKTAGGLLMLAAQAVRASERFCGVEYHAGTAEKIAEEVERRQTTVFLIGMPGCGKSTIGKVLAKECGREFIDTDCEIQKVCGRSPSEIITKDGTAAFRKLETDILRSASARCGAVVATGGGVVTVPENLRLMRQNGIIVFLDASLDQLETCDRPLSAAGVERLAEERMPLYRSWAVATFKVRGIKKTVSSIRGALLI